MRRMLAVSGLVLLASGISWAGTPAASEATSAAGLDCRVPEFADLNAEQRKELAALKAQLVEELTYVDWALQAKRGVLERLVLQRAAKRVIQAKHAEIDELQLWVEARRVKFHLDLQALLTSAQRLRYVQAETDTTDREAATASAEPDLDPETCPWGDVGAGAWIPAGR